MIKKKVFVNILIMSLVGLLSCNDGGPQDPDFSGNFLGEVKRGIGEMVFVSSSRRIVLNSGKEITLSLKGTVTLMFTDSFSGWKIVDEKLIVEEANNCFGGGSTRENWEFSLSGDLLTGIKLSDGATIETERCEKNIERVDNVDWGCNDFEGLICT